MKVKKSLLLFCLACLWAFASLHAQSGLDDHLNYFGGRDARNSTYQPCYIIN